MFDEALRLLNGYWNGATFDGYAVHSSSVPCTDEPTPFNDFGKVEENIKARIRQLEANADLKAFRKELEMLGKHSVWRANQIEFYRCSSKDCSHCSQVQPRARNLLATVRKCGGQMPTPEPDPVRPGHFKTLLQAIGSPATLQIDQHLPSFNGAVPLCTRGCKCVLPCEARKQRHNVLFHLEERRADQRRQRQVDRAARIDTPQQQFKCGFLLPDGPCTFTASSKYYLRQHKESVGHKRQYSKNA